MTIRVWWVFGQRRWVSEVVNGCRCEDRNNNIIMAEVGIQLLSEREVPSIVGEGAVDTRVGGGDKLVGQAGNELL
jgi:hypothetical protein